MAHWAWCVLHFRTLRAPKCVPKNSGELGASRVQANLENTFGSSRPGQLCPLRPTSSRLWLRTAYRSKRIGTACRVSLERPIPSLQSRNLEPWQFFHLCKLRGPNLEYAVDSSLLAPKRRPSCPLRTGLGPGYLSKLQCSRGKEACPRV